jgi:hypothetical protein
MCGTWNRLFTTLAYELATSVPELRLPIQEAVEHDKLISGLSMAVQFQRLLLEPLAHTPQLGYIPTIVLDGLDECKDRKVQQQILRLFIEAIRAGQLPIRILITSRPEPYLREILQAEETFGICRHSELSADAAAYDDIRAYLRDEFSAIRSKYIARGIALGDIWPPPEALAHLVRKSCGIFVYATTVIRFIDDEYSHPTDRLESVLSLDPQSTAPLDDLYTRILSALPQKPQQLHILHAIWQGTLSFSRGMDPEEIDMLLNMRRGTCRLTLRGLHSLLFVPPIRHPLALRWCVEVLHASFADYLCDPRRSGQWCVSTSELWSDHLHFMIRLLSSLPPLTFYIQTFYRYE